MLNAFYYLVSRTIAEPLCCRPLQSEFIHGIWVLGSGFSVLGSGLACICGGLYYFVWAWNRDKDSAETGGRLTDT